VQQQGGEEQAQLQISSIANFECGLGNKKYTEDEEALNSQNK
jgi:hypothetical protein